MIQPAAKKCRFCGTDVEPIKHFAPVAIPGESEAARMMRLQNEARGKKARPVPEPWSAKSRKQAAIVGAGIVALLLVIAGLQNAGILPRPQSSEATPALQTPIASPAPYRARIASGIDSPWDANHYPKLVAKLGRKSFDRATRKFPAIARYAAKSASCDEVSDIGISSHSTANSVSYFATCTNAFQIKISETELDGHNDGTTTGFRSLGAH